MGDFSFLPGDILRARCDWILDPLARWDLVRIPAASTVLVIASEFQRDTYSVVLARDERGALTEYESYIRWTITVVWNSTLVRSDACPQVWEVLYRV